MRAEMPSVLALMILDALLCVCVVLCEILEAVRAVCTLSAAFHPLASLDRTVHVHSPTTAQPLRVFRLATATVDPKGP